MAYINLALGEVLKRFFPAEGEKLVNLLMQFFIDRASSARLGLKLEYIHTYMAEHGCLATTLFLAFRFYISASTVGQQPRATLDLFLASVC